MLTNSLSLLILSSALTLRRDKSITYSRSTIIIILCNILYVFHNLYLSSLGNGIALFNGLFFISNINESFHNFIYIITLFIFFFTGFYSQFNYYFNNINNYIKLNEIKFLKKKIVNFTGEQYKIIEYALIILFIISGAIFISSSNDIISVFLSIELQSYGLYILAALYRNSESSTSAALMYFLLGGLSSCFILLGTALLYANSGTTNLEGFYIINSLFKLNEYNKFANFDINYINYGIAIMSIGFLFKISAAPFHFWSPDVYDAIPTIITTFVAIVPKISILIFLLEIVHHTSISSIDIKDFDWRYILLLSSFMSLVVGTVLGLSQSRIKRLYAYSTISHLGFILLALSINSIESIQAFVFYLIQYSISNLNAFILLVIIGITLYNYKSDTSLVFIDKINSPVQFIKQIKGYFFFNPFIAISLTITIYSFIGIPPLLGFFAKQMVISAALDKGFILLTIVAILTSVISAVYYLSVIKQIFFDKFSLELKSNIKDVEHVNLYIKPYNTLSITVSIITIFILSFILVYQSLIIFSFVIGITLFNI